MVKQRERQKKTQNEERVTRDKNAFSGQTKGDRRILRLIADHFEANLWIKPRAHRGAGFRDSTQRRTPCYYLFKSHPQYIFFSENF